MPKVHAPRPDVLRFGRDRLRLAPWRGRADVAWLAPSIDGPAPGSSAIRSSLDVIGARGFQEVVTPALSPVEQAAFLSAGFRIREHLHLLEHDLQDLPELPDVSRRGAGLRRGRRRDQDQVLAVDGRAFSSFWRLDAMALHEALTATPVVRYRVADGSADDLAAGLAGYAVTGRAGTRGYLQRLAVDPDVQGRGLGLALVLDALHWARRRGTRTLLVNTQEANAAAMGLYQRTGFRRCPDGLAVLVVSLDGIAP